MKRILDIDKLQEAQQRQKKQKTYWVISSTIGSIVAVIIWIVLLGSTFH